LKSKHLNFLNILNNSTPQPLNKNPMRCLSLSKAIFHSSFFIFHVISPNATILTIARICCKRIFEAAWNWEENSIEASSTFVEARKKRCSAIQQHHFPDARRDKIL